VLKTRWNPRRRTRSAKGFGRIGDDKYHRAGSSLEELGKDLLIDLGIHVEQPESAARIIAVDRSSSLLIQTGSDHDQGGTHQIRVFAIVEIDGPEQWGAVLHVGHDRPLPGRGFDSRERSLAQNPA